MKTFLRVLIVLGVLIVYNNTNGQIAPPESVQAFLKIKHTGQVNFDPANDAGALEDIDIEVRAIIELSDTTSVSNLHISFDAVGQSILNQVVPFDAVSTAPNLFYERDGYFVTLILGSYTGLTNYTISCQLEDSSGVLSGSVDFSN
ncbi:MAG: hypothetical protein AAF598_14145 [Bacteroidota bacterium]